MIATATDELTGGGDCSSGGFSRHRRQLQVRSSTQESSSEQRMELQLGSSSGCNRVCCSRSSSPGEMLVAASARELTAVDAAALVT